MLLKALVNLGRTEVDAEIYLLAREGPQKGRDVAEVPKLQKQQLYRGLKHLQEKSVINATLERLASFSAVSVERILDFLIESKKEQALALQE